MADTTKAPASSELEALRLQYPNAQFLPIDQNPVQVFGPAGEKNKPVSSTFTMLDINKDVASSSIRSIRAQSYVDPDLDDVMFNFTTNTLLPAAKAAFAEADESLRDITGLVGRQLKMSARVNTNWVQTTVDRGAGINTPVIVTIAGVKHYVWGRQHTASVDGPVILVKQAAPEAVSNTGFAKNVRNTGVLWAGAQRAYSNVAGQYADEKMAKSFSELAVE